MRVVDENGIARWRPRGRREPCHFGGVPDHLFSWGVQGDATVAQRADLSVVLTAQAGTGDNWRVRYMAAPARPYTLICAFYPLLTPVSSAGEAPAAAVGWRGSVLGIPGALALFRLFYDGTTTFTLQADYTHWNSPTIFSATAAGPVYADWLQCGGAVWVKLVDDGVNRYLYFGPDGVDWVFWTFEARTNFLVPDGLCIAANADNVSYQAAIKVMDWHFD